MNESASPPLSPNRYPRCGSNGLGVVGGKRVHFEVGDGMVATGELEEIGAEALDAEDSEPRKPIATPDLPPRSVIEEHRIDHWPPRSWCDECNEGHGRERRHGRVPDSHRVAIVSMDYAFLTRKGAIVEQGEEGFDDDEALKMLIVKDSLSRSVFAHAVPRKGIDDKRYAVDMVVQDVLWLGYSKVLLKSDNEPAIVKLLREALGSLKVSGLEQVGEEHSPPYDSQANGSVEAAVKQVKCRIRTLKLCLERRIGKRIPPRHPIMTWLVPHAASILRWRARGDNGKTPYEAVRLRPFTGKLIGFAEQCSYKMRSKEPIDDEHRFHHGIFLGMCPSTGQYIVHDVARKVIKMARTIKRHPDETKWNAGDVEAVAVSPYNQHVADEQGVALADRPEQPGDADQPKAKAGVRKLYIKGADIQAFGYTVGCVKCDHDRRYGPGGTTKGHSDACRARIVAELSKTPEGQRRLSAADERVNRHITEIHEDAAPHVHGGEDSDARVVPEAELRFEDLEESEKRVDAPVVADEVAADVPAPRSPARYVNGEEVPLCVDGQEVPGMEVDVVHGEAVDVRSPSASCRVDRGGAVKPSFCDGLPQRIADEVNNDPEDCDLREMCKFLDQAAAAEVRQVDEEILSIVHSLGGNTGKYRRERGRALRHVISEIYSPPRVSAVAKLCPSFGILPGFALDLTVADSDGRQWDFDDEEMRRRAWAKVKSERPLLLIGSPMCTAFSAWQHINNAKRDPATVAKEYARGLSHLRFCCELYAYQIE